MTKDQAVNFLTNEGHLTEVNDGSGRVSFKVRGHSLDILTYDDDPQYLRICASFQFDRAGLDELEVFRSLALLQEQYKVVKIAAEPGGPGLMVAAEQFLPECREFASLFWRTADLVLEVAMQVYSELVAAVAANASVIADAAADQFTEALESELHLKRET